MTDHLAVLEEMSGLVVHNDKTLAQYEALRAAIALMRGQSEVPFGMVLMPIDPTPEMLARYEHVRSGGDWQPNVFRLSKRQLARHRKAYAAMLPPPPKEDTADEQ